MKPDYHTFERWYFEMYIHHFHAQYTSLWMKSHLNVLLGVLLWNRNLDAEILQLFKRYSYFLIFYTMVKTYWNRISSPKSILMAFFKNERLPFQWFCLISKASSALFARKHGLCCNGAASERVYGHGSSVPIHNQILEKKMNY